MSDFAFVRDVQASAAGTSQAISVDATGFASGTVLVITGFGRSGGANDLASVTDNQGNTWSVAVATNDGITGTFCAWSFLSHALGSGDTITLNFSGSITVAAVTISDFSYSGGGTPTLDSAPAVTRNTGTTVATPSATTTGDDLLVGWAGDVQSLTTTGVAAGWAESGARNAQGGPTSLDTIYIEEAAAGTYSGSVTYNSALSGNNYQGLIALVAGAAGASAAQRIDLLASQGQQAI